MNFDYAMNRMFDDHQQAKNQSAALKIVQKMKKKK